jgi:hypothetical protein
MKITLVGDAYTTLSPAFSCQTCINFYPELADLKYVGGQNEIREPKYEGYLVNTPGLSLFTTLGTNSVRCLYEFNEVLYGVSDNKFYSINTSGTKTQLGTLNTSSGLAQIEINFDNELLIVDGTNGYTYATATNTFAQITDSNFLNGASTCTFQEGYGIINNDTVFALSSLNDFTTWPVLQQTAFGSYQDVIVSVKSTKLETWVFGKYHTEVWYNAGATPFPFARRNYVNIDMGCAAKFSVVQINNTLFWIARDKKGRCMVVTANNYNPQVISTDAINAALTSYATVSDAFAYIYQDAGHIFIVFTFPTQNVTWVYDAVTDLWHQRSSLIGVALMNFQNYPLRHASNCYAYFNGKHYVGDYQSGNVYEMNLNTCTDNSLPILRERITSFQQNDLKQTTIYSFQADVQSGTGTATGQGSNPAIMFSYSKDYGRTWSTDRILEMGETGQYTKRVRTNTLGAGRTWNFRLRYSDPAPCRIMQAQVTLTGGSS